MSALLALVLASSTPVEVFVGANAMGTPRGAGTSLEGGVRVEVARFCALSFDLGYGLVSATPFMQDRWWLMPSAALVLPLGRVRLELGGGLGIGTTTGFASWARWADDHTEWDAQALPAVRAHAVLSVPVTERFSVYARAEAAALIWEGGFGFRAPGAVAGPDTTWAHVGAGAMVRL